MVGLENLRKYKELVMNYHADSCLFCGSNDIIVPQVGIAFGMSGNDYSFCRKCLEDIIQQHVPH